MHRFANHNTACDIKYSLKTAVSKVNIIVIHQTDDYVNKNFLSAIILCKSIM